MRGVAGNRSIEPSLLHDIVDGEHQATCMKDGRGSVS